MNLFKWFRKITGKELKERLFFLGVVVKTNAQWMVEIKELHWFFESMDFILFKIKFTDSEKKKEILEFLDRPAPSWFCDSVPESRKKELVQAFDDLKKTYREILCESDYVCKEDRVLRKQWEYLFGYSPTGL